MNNDFKRQLAEYKDRIDADIAVYAQHVRETSHEQYGEQGYLIADAFLDLLNRGGKRLRGALVIAGYEMCGGVDRDMIVRAATALEMVHAYILIIDDIQDRSSMRRGQATVHEKLATYHHQERLSGDSAHAGVSLALNAALMGSSAAHMLFAGLQVEPELKNKVLGILNHTIMVTVYGQTYDILNEMTPQVTVDTIKRTMELKTANYTILNPLCIGMVLAGASCEDTDAVRDYAIQTGLIFQITDDILGIFGTDEQTGKSVVDDIREGKQTLLTAYAQEYASPDDQTTLRAALGNSRVSEEELLACQTILRDSGALDFALSQAGKHVQLALSALEHPPERWNNQQVAFLRQLVLSLKAREQ